MQYEDKTESLMLEENKDARIIGNKIELMRMKMDTLLGGEKIKQDSIVKKMPIEHINDN